MRETHGPISLRHRNLIAVGFEDTSIHQNGSCDFVATNRAPPSLKPNHSIDIVKKLLLFPGRKQINRLKLALQAFFWL